MAAALAKAEREEDRVYQGGAGAGNAAVEKRAVEWPDRARQFFRKIPVLRGDFCSKFLSRRKR